MKKTIQISFLIIAVIALSCQNKKEFVQSEHGFEYKIIKEGGGKSVEVNDFIAYKVDYYNDDQLLLSMGSDKNGLPFIFQYREELESDTTPMLMAIKMLKKGDSAIFKFNADEFYKDTFRQPLPDSIVEDSKIFAYTLMDDIIPQDSINIYMEKKENILHVGQLEELEDYFAEEGLDVKTTDSGLSYIITEEGQGPSPQAGDTVTVHYKGTFFVGGETFDSSYDDDGEPIEFPIGQGYVIPGWDEGIALLNKNAKAKFFIPSKIAYGIRGYRGAIPPNSILVFEVELIDFR